MTHPLAFTDRPNGAKGMKAGDRVRYTIDGRTGVADEFLQDGDAFVTWDDGTFGEVKWHHLELAPETPSLPVPATAADRAKAVLAVCEEITDIMRVYREQEAERGYVDTPGGLEHMGDVWRLLARWDDALTAASLSIVSAEAETEVADYDTEAAERWAKNLLCQQQLNPSLRDDDDINLAKAHLAQATRLHTAERERDEANERFDGLQRAFDTLGGNAARVVREREAADARAKGLRDALRDCRTAAIDGQDIIELIDAALAPAADKGETGVIVEEVRNEVGEVTGYQSRARQQASAGEE